MGPIDYLGLLPQIDFAKDIQGGLAAGQLFQQRNLQNEQKQAAIDSAKQYQIDIQAAMQNPTPQAFSALALKYPSQREAIKQSFDGLSADQQKNELNDAWSIASTLHSGRPDLALSEIDKRIQAHKNSGQPTDTLEFLRKHVQDDPKSAYGQVLHVVSGLPGGDKILTNLSTIGQEQRADSLAPAELRAKTAGATKAEVDAGVAQATAPQQIQKATIDNQIAELDAQIRAANSETQRGQLQLERDKLVQQQAEKATDQGQAAQGQLDSAQQAIDTVKRLATDPLLESSFGVGSAIGKIASYIPGTDNKDYRAQLETLKAQLFLPAVAQLKAAGGGGALSDAEGKKLSAAVAALDPDMSPKAFKNALGVVQKYLEQGYQKALASKKLPTSGGAFVVKHPTFGNVNEGDINRLLKMYPGASREQVMLYLNQTGGQ